MIEVKAKADVERQGTSISTSMEGMGIELVNEAIAIIKSVMGSLKSTDQTLHMVALAQIAMDSSILIGDDDESDFEAFMAKEFIKETNRRGAN